MSLLAALAAALALALAGGFPFGAAGAARGWGALPLAFAAGAVSLHLGLAVATLAGLAWSPALVAGALLASGLAWAALARFRRDPPGWPRPGAWELPALAVMSAVVLLGAAGWLSQPDFFYHWGLKAGRFLEIGGADYYFLASPSSWRLHPDYPLLAPELLLLPSLGRGGFDEAAALAMAALWIALVPLALARALAEAGLDPASRGRAIAIVALALGGFAIGYGLVGAADPLIALALALALPPLLAAERTPARGWELGLAAALAAASKLEGVPLAALLVGADLVTRAARERRFPGLAHLARTALPAALVVLPWFGLARAYRLFLETNAGAFDAGRTSAILPALGATSLHADWALFPLALAALPWLLGQRRLRPAALVLLAQLGFYLIVYWTGPVDSRFYVLSTFPRLLFHLLPATLALVAIAALGPRAAAAPREAPFAPPPAPGESAS
jgi:hypothetical protein